MEINNGDASGIIENAERVQVNGGEAFIFKVHNLLRNVNSKAYDPEIISIGPYHRYKPHLQMMEAHKLRFKDLLLQRKNQELSTYLDAIKPHQERARKCYAEPTGDLSPDEFVEMLVLDGLFIIELLRKFHRFISEFYTSGPADFELHDIRNDPLFKMSWPLNLLQRDLMLFENQIPFFILNMLHGMIASPDELNNLAHNFFSDLFPGSWNKRTTACDNQGTDIKHILDLMHMNWGSQKVSNPSVRYNMGILRKMGSSTELKETGVKLVKIEDEGSFDIEFKNGKFSIELYGKLT